MLKYLVMGDKLSYLHTQLRSDLKGRRCSELVLDIISYKVFINTRKSVLYESLPSDNFIGQAGEAVPSQFRVFSVVDKVSVCERKVIESMEKMQRKLGKQERGPRQISQPLKLSVCVCANAPNCPLLSEVMAKSHTSPTIGRQQQQLVARL